MDGILIKNVRLIDPSDRRDEVTDILIEEERIAKIGAADPQDMGSGCQVIDGTGLIAAPGLVDVHVHFRDPGYAYKEDILTGAQAAAAGGFTSVIMMANTKPAIDSVETLQYALEKGGQTGIHVYSCAAVTSWMDGMELTDMEALKAAGAVGFTDDGKPLMNVALVEEAMQKVKELDVPISFHEENPRKIENNGINQGKASQYYGVGGSPSEAEVSLIRRDLELALKIGAQVNIQHISTKEGVELVRQAKKRGGSNIHAEATPHHFSLTEDAVIKYGTLAKMNPPLRTEEDRQAILEGLRDGTIDLIATDHAPHSREEKDKPITQAPSGIIGLETALPLAVTNLVREGVLDYMQLFDRMSLAPAKLYKLPAGEVREGAPADIVLFDADAVKAAGHYQSKSDNSPFTGMELYGVVKYTICSGKIVWEG